MDWYGWRPELVADLVGIDALWIEADRSARSGDTPEPVGSLPARRREAPLAIRRTTGLKQRHDDWIERN
jgi:hypothetical protein